MDCPFCCQAPWDCDTPECHAAASTVEPVVDSRTGARSHIHLCDRCLAEHRSVVAGRLQTVLG
jgi:hypothetical protein